VRSHHIVEGGGHVERQCDELDADAGNAVAGAVVVVLADPSDSRSATSMLMETVVITVVYGLGA
jgi:hypothetical protein